MIQTISKYSKTIALLLFILVLFLSLPNICDGHGNEHEGEHGVGDDHHHDHHHHHHAHAHDFHEHDHHDHQETPSYKYSKEANVKSSSPGSGPSVRKEKKVQSMTSIWSEALSSTIIISIAPFIILYFIPLNNRREHESFLKILLSFASGGLLGDAFLHLIPHALVPHSHHGDHQHSHSHSHSHSHDSNIGIWVLAGILVFLIVEKSVRLIKGEHSHSHTHETDDVKAETKEDEKPSKEDKEEDEKIFDDDKDEGNVFIARIQTVNTEEE